MLATAVAEKKSPADASAVPERMLADELRKIDAHWRACCYLAAGERSICARIRWGETHAVEQISQRHLRYCASPALASSYIHLNRPINKYDLDAIFMAGPGHGAPGVLGPVYLEGTYSEVYPTKGEDEEGMRLFFKEFSFPGGIGSHCTPELPGSIHSNT